MADIYCAARKAPKLTARVVPWHSASGQTACLYIKCEEDDISISFSNAELMFAFCKKHNIPVDDQRETKQP